MRWVLAGVREVRPVAAEGIHQACLGIKRGASIGIVCDTGVRSPAFSQTYLTSLRNIELQEGTERC